MPIARVMNNPDGSTPAPALGGGDANGTLATSILGAHAGTGAGQFGCPRHLKFQTSTLSLPSVAVPSDGIGQSLPIAIEEGGEIDPILEAEGAP